MKKQEVKRMQQLAGITLNEMKVNKPPIVGSKLDYKKVSNIELDGVDMGDYPDFSDAYIVYAEYDGVPMTSDQIDELNDDSEFVHQAAMDWFF